MSGRVRGTETAAEDLATIVERIRRDDPVAAQRVALTIFDAVEVLPAIAIGTRESFRRLPVLRQRVGRSNGVVEFDVHQRSPIARHVGWGPFP